jgi:hypothetical protein
MAHISQAVFKREKELRQYIERHSETFGLDPNLIRAVITQESRFVAKATSPTGAYGYGQFTTIGAKQVQNIAAMHPDAADLKDFTKRDADKPDIGVKAVCATFWWLMSKKYSSVADKKVQLEAAVTFYNSGGRPAALVIKHGGHAAAKEAISQLPKRYQSQSMHYAPEVAIWFIAWYDHFKNSPAAPLREVPDSNPFDEEEPILSPSHQALIEALTIMASNEESTDCIVNSRDGLTELTLIFPGEIDL